MSTRWVRSTTGKLAVIAGVASTCGHAQAQESVANRIEPVIYGNDDRHDWYAETSLTTRARTRDAIVAFVPDVAIDLAHPGLSYPPFVDGFWTLDDWVRANVGAPLCAGERFAAQASIADCSGTLIDDDLVLTASHCVPTLAECQASRLVFDYLLQADSSPASIDANDVYACARVLVRAKSSRPLLDYAIIQLERPVVGRRPAGVATGRAALAVGTPLLVAGFGTGLPMKLDAGGSVIDPRAASLDSFVADTDTFAGNSGSGVFTADGTLVGVLDSGNADYRLQGSCVVANVLPASEAGEVVGYAARAIDALCARGYPSSLCPSNPTPSCGDHFCSAGEDATLCAGDCATPHCADDVCSPELGETAATCAFDCARATSTGGCAVATNAAEAGGPRWLGGALAVLAALLGRPSARRGVRTGPR